MCIMLSRPAIVLTTILKIRTENKPKQDKKKKYNLLSFREV